MGRTKPPYAAAFKQQMVELAMAGRSPAELSREFGVSAQSITAWVTRAAADASDAGRTASALSKGALSTAERGELARLRRQVRQLQQERDILARGDEEDKTVQWTVLPRNAWFAVKDAKTSIGSTNS